MVSILSHQSHICCLLPGSSYHLFHVFFFHHFSFFRVIKYTQRQMWLTLALEMTDCSFQKIWNLKFIAQRFRRVQSKFQSIQSVIKTCVFCSSAQKKLKLPCGVCYWKIIFGIIFLITGLSLGILPPPLESYTLLSKTNRNAVKYSDWNLFLLFQKLTFHFS